MSRMAALAHGPKDRIITRLHTQKHFIYFQQTVKLKKKQYVHPQKDAIKKTTSVMHTLLNPKKKLVFKKLIRKNNKQPE